MSNAIYERCDICHAVENSMAENPDKQVFIYLFGGYAGYGSVHDGDYIGLHICSECLDRMLANRPHDTADTSLNTR